ncbi:MAG: matrixin family metalloprotease [Myxococcota bacterium]
MSVCQQQSFLGKSWCRWIVGLVCGGVWIWTLGVGSEVWGYAVKKTAEGLSLSWKRLPVSYAVDVRGLQEYFQKFPKRGAVGSAFTAVERSFLAWQNVSCAQGVSKLQFLPQGTLRDARVGADDTCADCNTNVVVFHQGSGTWPYDRALLVKTSVHFEPSSGEIFDADIEVNAEHFAFSTQVQEAEFMYFDLQSVLTYAVGEFLGLAESQEKGATMQKVLVKKNIEKRSLEIDDRLGVCALYPSAPLNVPTYEQGEVGVSCASVPVREGWWFALGLFMALGLRRRVLS